MTDRYLLAPGFLIYDRFLSGEERAQVESYLLQKYFEAFSPKDCNDNEIPDECDIADGTSFDLNSNGIPDECDTPGDNDGDGDVDAFDLAQQLGSWGPYEPCPPFILADIDQDCDVDAFDLAQLLGNWGP